MKKQEKVVTGEIDEVEDFDENSTSDDDLEQEEQEEA